MRKEQREYIIAQIVNAVHSRMANERKQRPVDYTAEEVVSYLSDKGIEVKDPYYAHRMIKMPVLQEHADNKEYLDTLNRKLNEEVNIMRTSLMLEKDPDAVSMLNAALERIKGV